MDVFVFLFIAAILSMIATAAIVCIICKHAKLKALLTGIAFQPVGQQMLYLLYLLYVIMRVNIANL